MRANTQNVQQGEQETRGVGEGSTNHWGTETLEDIWKREGWSGVHGVNKMDRMDIGQEINISQKST